MEPRDEESKARIAREVAAAVAEGTNNPVDGIVMVFHELPRGSYATGLSYGPRSKRKPRTDSGLPTFATAHLVTVEDEAALVSLRNEVVNPALARQDGFVSTLLLRLREPNGGYLSINKWMSEKDWVEWGKTEDDRSTTKSLMNVGKLWDPAPFGWRADIVHQRFGARGGERL